MRSRSNHAAPSCPGQLALPSDTVQLSHPVRQVFFSSSLCREDQTQGKRGRSRSLCLPLVFSREAARACSACTVESRVAAGSKVGPCKVLLFLICGFKSDRYVYTYGKCSVHVHTHMSSLHTEPQIPYLSPQALKKHMHNRTYRSYSVNSRCQCSRMHLQLQRRIHNET